MLSTLISCLSIFNGYSIPWTFSYRVARAPCVPFSQLSSCASDTFPKHRMLTFQKAHWTYKLPMWFQHIPTPRKNLANNDESVGWNHERAWNNQQVRSQKCFLLRIWRGNQSRWLHISVAIFPVFPVRFSATGSYQASGTAGHVCQLRQRGVGKMRQGGSEAWPTWGIELYVTYVDLCIYISYIYIYTHNVCIYVYIYIHLYVHI